MKSKEPKKTTLKPAVRRKPAPQKSILSEDLTGQVARRAFEIYVRRIHQGALDDWLQAEREILRQRKTRNSDEAHRGGYAAQEQD